ncbi:MAG: PilN domain-containing protein [Bryobacteraceae bacterium]
MNLPPELKKWIAFGAGVGIEVRGATGAESLHIAAASVRPGTVRVLGEMTVENAGEHAGVWGTEYAAFVKKHGLGGAAATILLPRREVILRQLSLPGVAAKDLAQAVHFQLDGLHPFPEEQTVASWALIPGTSTVLVAITRRTVLERYATLFGEAGVQVGSFTCSGVAIYSARHLFGAATTGEFLAIQETASGVEVYGESVVRPAFSATFPSGADRALAMAASEMRLESAVPQTFEDVLQLSPALPGAAAACSACPWLTLDVNLLPEAQRASNSRGLWIPAAVLGALVILLSGALLGFPQFERARYLKSLNEEISHVEPQANRAQALDRRITAARADIQLLDTFRVRTKSDMDVLGELTRILPPPTWVNLLDVNAAQVTIAGATAQAAGLLEVIDGSPLFEGSEFQSAPARADKEETFRIRAKREAGK